MYNFCLLKNKLPNCVTSAAWRSTPLQILGFASPPRDGFAFVGEFAC